MFTKKDTFKIIVVCFGWSILFFMNLGPKSKKQTIINSAVGFQFAYAAKRGRSLPGARH